MEASRVNCASYLFSRQISLNHTRGLWRPFIIFYRSEQTLYCNIDLIAGGLIFELKNNTDQDVTIQFIGVFNDILKFGKLNPNEFPLTILQGE